MGEPPAGELVDPRPSQDQVEAQAARMFGRGWKRPLERERARIDQTIAERLDAAREAVQARQAGR